MEAGRELDALIAEKVMGWRKYTREELETQPDADWWLTWWHDPHGRRVAQHSKTSRSSRVWAPSTDIAAAWQVWNKVSGNGWVIHKTITLGELSYFIFESSKTFENYQFIGSGDTLPLAICSAALTTVKQH